MAHDDESRQDDQPHIPRAAAKGLDRALEIQRPMVVAHVRNLRKRHPNATPEELVRILEKEFLQVVTIGGGATGAAAIIPGIGTFASLGLTAAETAGFLEASALFALSVTEVHGIGVTDPVRARTLVMALLLGNAGLDLIEQLAGQAIGKGKNRQVFLGELITKNLPHTLVNQIGRRMRKMFVRRFIARTGTGMIGRAMPFGVGAVIGGAGNRYLGKQVVNAAQEAFGPTPSEFPEAFSIDEAAAQRQLDAKSRKGKKAKK